MQRYVWALQNAAGFTLPHGPMLVFEATAMHPRVQVRTLRVMAESQIQAAVEAHASSGNLPKSRLVAGLYGIGFGEEAPYFANSQLGPKSLANCAEREDRKFCLPFVARNRSAPPALLKQLAFSPRPEIKRAVARNVSAPGAALEVLAGDAAEEIRYLVAFNPATPEMLRQDLAADESQKVRENALFRIEVNSILGPRKAGRCRLVFA